MKLFIIITITILFSSCNGEIIIRNNDTQLKPYIVQEIVGSPFKGEEKLSLYKAVSKSNYFKFVNIINFIDSIGKFNVRDTVYVNYSKIK